MCAGSRVAAPGCEKGVTNMKKNVCGVGKKVLASALSAAMVVAFAPAVGPAVGSDDAVAYAEEAGSATTQLPAAVKGVITLDSDVTINEWPTQSFFENKLVFEMNGHTIKYLGGPETMWTLEGNSGKTLSFKNGTIEAPEMGKGKTAGIQVLFKIERGCTLNLDNVELTTTASALWPNGDAAAVNVYDSTINAGVYAVATNAASPDNYKVRINLEDSTFNTYYGYSDNDGDACPVCINIPCTLNMTACEVNGTRQGVMVRGGDAVITDSRINLRETKSLFADGGGCNLADVKAPALKQKYATSVWGSGNEIPMSALVVGNRSANNSYKYPATCILNNTQVAAPEGYAKVYAYGAEEPDENNTSCDCAVLKADKLSGLSDEDVKGTDQSENKVSVSLDEKSNGVTAAIGDSQYYTLAGAIRFAENGDTVKLVDDVDLVRPCFVAEDITLDLNGKTISNSQDIWDIHESLLEFSGEAVITGNGTIRAKKDDCYAINVNGKGLTVKSGTIVGNVSAIQVQKGLLSIEGGNFSLDQKWDGKSTYLLNCIDNAYKDGTAKIVVRGGTFEDFDPSNNGAEGEGTSFVAPGYTVSDNGGTFFVYYPTPDPTPTPEPKPEPTPAAPGTGVSGTDAAGNTVDATVTDNSKVTLPDGTKADGSVEYKGTTSASGSAEPVSTVSVPSTVTTSDGSTYVVTKIADKAFEGQEQLTKVTIPETVVEIGERAFAGTSVENVVLPAATTVIGAGVFQGCDDLKSVDIFKAAITEIPADAFNGTSIDSIKIPATVTSIGARAFKGTALTSAELPDAVKAIEKSTFENCAALKSLTTSATVVGYKALAGCTSLKGIDLSMVTELGKYALKGNSKLKTLTTGAKLKAIGYKALSGTKVKTLTISSKKLTSASVKGSLKGSSVKKVEVAVSGSKKTVNKYVAKYKKVFKKSNSGKSVDVVAKKIK